MTGQSVERRLPTSVSTRREAGACRAPLMPLGFVRAWSGQTSGSLMRSTQLSRGLGLSTAMTGAIFSAVSPWPVPLCSMHLRKACHELRRDHHAPADLSYKW